MDLDESGVHEEGYVSFVFLLTCPDSTVMSLNSKMAILMTR